MKAPIMTLFKWLHYDFKHKWNFRSYLNMKTFLSFFLFFFYFFLIET